MTQAAALTELKQALEDETRAKLTIQTRRRQTESKREVAKGASDEEEQNKQTPEKHVQMMQQQVRMRYISFVYPVS